MKKEKNKSTFKIPKKIFLLGEVFKTEFTDLPETDAGFLNFTDKIIQFDKSLDEGKDDNELQHVFWHELGHYFANYYRLEDGEIFADAFSRFIIKILKQLEDARRKNI